MTKHDHLIETICAEMHRTGKPMSVPEMRVLTDYQRINVTVSRESRQPNARIKWVRHGVYALPGYDGPLPERCRRRTQVEMEAA